MNRQNVRTIINWNIASLLEKAHYYQLRTEILEACIDYVRAPQATTYQKRCVVGILQDNNIDNFLIVKILQMLNRLRDEKVYMQV